MDEPKEIGEWLMICVLGAGAFGKVTLWRNEVNNEYIAVKKCKFMLPNHLTSRQRERWIHEVNIMKSLDNENIVAYKELPSILNAAFERFNPTRLPILSMEYCTKGNLRQFLIQTKNLMGCNESDVRCILKDVSNAVSYLHNKNITHRDIKPENIVIQDCDGRHIYKLIDLGYAKELETIASFVGTLPYLAPEIFHNNSYNCSVDYWSLGILAYEIITGVHPFLSNKTPVERFNYLREKSDADISITITKDGNVKFLKEILLHNRLSPLFRRYIEDWLRLLLRYDGGIRGLRNGEKVVFTELEAILNRKMLKIFSVFNYRELVYEISENMTLPDIKAMIERDTKIPASDQMYAADEKVIIGDDTFSEFFQANSQKTLYVFNKATGFEKRTVSLPQRVQEVFQLSPEISSKTQLKTLFPHTIVFIRRELELLSLFDAALIVQIDHVLYMFAQLKQVYSETRESIIRLNVQVDYCSRYNERQRRNLPTIRRAKYINYLTEERRTLQQAKELTENFNSLTDRFLKVSRMEAMTKHAVHLKKALASTEDDMSQKYNHANTILQRINSDTNPTTELVKILNVILEIPWKAIFGNEDLNIYLRSALLIQRKLERLLKWCNALNKHVNETSSSIQECEMEKCIYLQNASAQSNQMSLVFPSGLEEDTLETTEIIQNNIDLRYRIQEVSNQGSAYLRNVQKDMICFLNGVILPASQSE